MRGCIAFSASKQLPRTSCADSVRPVSCERCSSVRYQHALGRLGMKQHSFSSGCDRMVPVLRGSADECGVYNSLGVRQMLYESAAGGQTLRLQVWTTCDSTRDSLARCLAHRKAHLVGEASRCHTKSTSEVYGQSTPRRVMGSYGIRQDKVLSCASQIEVTGLK